MIYKDSAIGQIVQMSKQYGHAWVSTTWSSNEYILTGSPSFNWDG